MLTTFLAAGAIFSLSLLRLNMLKGLLVCVSAFQNGYVDDIGGIDGQVEFDSSTPTVVVILFVCWKRVSWIILTVC